MHRGLKYKIYNAIFLLIRININILFYIFKNLIYIMWYEKQKKSLSFILIIFFLNQ